jgi:hypothetical protein
MPPEHTFLRTCNALAAALVLMRAIDLARDRTAHPLHVRVGMMFSLLDLRAVRPMSRRIDWRRLAIALSYGATSALAYYIALHAASAPIRWLFGAVGVYCMADAAAAFTHFLTDGLGTAIPKQHDKPILSRSVREFWSLRWNLNVRDWLFRNCHRPFARRGRPAVGIVCAFLASTLLHFWMVVVPLGWFWAAIMASFFLLQGVLVLFESRLSFARWSSPARHAWTVVAVLGPSPLFVEPFLRIFG